MRIKGLIRRLNRGCEPMPEGKSDDSKKNIVWSCGHSIDRSCCIAVEVPWKNNRSTTANCRSPGIGARLEQQARRLLRHHCHFLQLLLRCLPAWAALQASTEALSTSWKASPIGICGDPTARRKMGWWVQRACRSRKHQGKSRLREGGLRAMPSDIYSQVNGRIIAALE